MPFTTDQLWTTRTWELIRHVIEGVNTVAISGHFNPDGDSIGTMLSLGLGLESIGKQVFMVCADEIPCNYRLLPGVSRLVKSMHHKVDLAIAVDCGSKEMLGANVDVLEKAGIVIEIDHHRCRSPFGDISLVDPDASAAGELIYELLTELGIPITVEIAQNILTSIMVETNSFRLPGIRPQTFEICADLLKTGVDYNNLAETVYWVTSKQTSLLTGICLSRCKFSETGEVAWAKLTRADFLKAEASDADGDPLTEKIRSIQGVKIAILFRENSKQQWRVSFRSKEGIDVSQLAEQFGGGGHLSAAGCTIPKSTKLIKQILNSAAELLLNHNKLQFSNPEYKINTGIPALVYYDSDWKHIEKALPIYSKPAQKIAY